MTSSPGQQNLFDGREASGHAYIDQVDSATDEEEPLSDPDDDVFFDDLRVEDEDWEIAERGSFFFFRSALPLTHPFPPPFGRLHQTVQPTSAARRRTIPQRLGEHDLHVTDKIHCRPAPRHQPPNNNERYHHSLEERQDRRPARCIV